MIEFEENSGGERSLECPLLELDLPKTGWQQTAISMFLTRWLGDLSADTVGEFRQFELLICAPEAHWKLAGVRQPPVPSRNNDGAPAGRQVNA